MEGRTTGAAQPTFMAFVVPRSGSILQMQSNFCSGDSSGHRGDEIGSGDDTDEFAVFQDGNRIDICIAHQGQQRPEWRCCNSARHCDAHNVDCSYWLVSFRVDQPAQSGHEAPIKAKCVFCCSADEVHLEDNAQEPLLLIHHG